MLTTQPTSRLPRKWTVAEDQKLREEVDAQMSEGEVKDWCRIASALPGRTNKDCRKRWHNSVAGGLKKGQWSKSEDLQLARGVQRFGQRWTLVSNTVQSRSADQCAKRWQQSLDPELDRSEWRDPEDKVLIEAVQKLGRHWKDIQRQHFPGRSKNSIKNRYTVLLRRYQNQGIALPFSAVTPEPTTPDIRQSVYSATDDDDNFDESFLPSQTQTQTQVSTPETQQSWPFEDEQFATWPSGDPFNITTEPSSFPPVPQQQHSLTHINTNHTTNTNMTVSNAPQWNWTTTATGPGTSYPQMTYQEPPANPNNYQNSLSPFTHIPHSHGSYSPVQTILGPTTSTLMGTGGRRSFPGSPAELPRSSPRPSSMVGGGLYDDPEVMAQMVWDSRFSMQGGPPYGAG
ncbi:hypothetical protein K505DRAFT_328375 [Melanomma pulvis-pyrius CBS 109.77]|uniref:Uncharacterized protein n=1 Tax=Melanomma pulvis-pyrius CBS 109.77 TaxID=1314802 RepID=A0A6A6WYD2_9PLEO|nr:hypothetical protein K505DRAFT_328375 [Melanomma pulvis-pyrius CBS 109.77]